MSQSSMFVSCIAFFALEFWIVGTIPVVPGGIVGTSSLLVGKGIVSGWQGLQATASPPVFDGSCAWYNIFCTASQTYQAINGFVTSIIWYVSQAFTPVTFFIGAFLQIQIVVSVYPWLMAINFLAGMFVVYSVVKGLI